MSRSLFKFNQDCFKVNLRYFIRCVNSEITMEFAAGAQRNVVLLRQSFERRREGSSSRGLVPCSPHHVAYTRLFWDFSFVNRFRMILFDVT